MKRAFSNRLSSVPLLAGFVLLFAIVACWALYLKHQFGRPALVTGWWLFAVLVFLGAFNGRKKLAMLPLGKASTWLRCHVAGGFLTLALFWLHAGAAWPAGGYERALAAGFYLLNLSGVVGWWMQRVYPRALSDTGAEVIFERIPAVIAGLRERAEAVVLECTQKAGNDTVARHYLETLHWFFQRPRFFFNHAFGGGKKARAWVREQCVPVRRYLGEAERADLDRLAELAGQKADIDFHYSAQTLMKTWLLLHLPLAALVLLLAVWHILLVHVYAV